MIAAISERPIWAHHLPAWVKFLALFAATLAVLATPSLAVLGAALAGVGMLYLSGGRDFALAGARALRGFVVIALIIGLWHLIINTPEGAALIAGRLLFAVALANFLTMTTPVSDMTGLFDRALAALRLPLHLRRRVALAMALTIRFLPALGERGARLREAWRARSPRRLSPRIVLPLALTAIDDAEQVAEALRARSGGI